MLDLCIRIFLIALKSAEIIHSKTWTYWRNKQKELLILVKLIDVIRKGNNREEKLQNYNTYKISNWKQILNFIANNVSFELKKL